ncbi:hypothetical protein ACX93W_26655 [Paenibacillus sp. CAU 1782]
MTREKEIEETIKEYFEKVGNGGGYTFPVGFWDGNHFFAYALHESRDNPNLSPEERTAIRQEKDVFWHLRECESFTNREIGLMAAAGISTVLGLRMLERGL